MFSPPEESAPQAPATLGSVVEKVRGHFRQAAASRPTDLGPREAVLLVSRALRLPESTVRAFPERTVDGPLVARVLELARRRSRGEPFAYLFGEREFYGRSFRVGPAVLIPRPETEHLIEATLALPLSPGARLLDVGTGSGCIAITVQLERSAWHVDATDLSLAALVTAQDNARRLGAPIGLACSDLASALRLDRYDVVLSNPPYVDRHDSGEMTREVLEHEPHLALFAADRGLAVYRRLLEACGIASVGYVVVELGAGQRAAVEQLAGHHGYFPIECRRDLAGHDRTLVLRQA